MSRESRTKLRRQLAHRRVQDEALRNAGWTNNGGRSLRDAMEARQREAATGSGHAGVGAMWLVVALVSQVLLWGGVATSSKVVAWAAGIVFVMCAVHWWRRRGLSDRRAWAAAGVAVLVVGGLGLAGAVSQIVENGKVVRVGSGRENEIEQAALLRRDLSRLAWWEELSTLSDDEARVRLEDITVAAEAAAQLAGSVDEEWETPELTEAARRIRESAGYLRDALVIRHDTALQPDSGKYDLLGPLLQQAEDRRQRAALLLGGADNG